MMWRVARTQCPAISSTQQILGAGGNHGDEENSRTVSLCGLANLQLASLNAKGLNKILEKVGEEAVEAIIAAKDAESGNGSSKEVINEVADLVFHTLVMLDRLGISHNEVLDVLASRQGLSGVEEKASRNQ